MQFKFDNYENGVGIPVDENGKPVSFMKKETEKISRKKSAKLPAEVLSVPVVESPTSAATESEKFSELEIKKAKDALGNAIGARLKTKIDAAGFENAGGGTVKGGEKFFNTEMFFMGKVVAAEFFENEGIVERIAEANRDGLKWRFDDAEEEALEKTINESFSSGKLDVAAYLSYQYNVVGFQVSKNGKLQKVVTDWRIANGLPAEMSPAEKRELEDLLMKELNSHEEMMRNFVELRKKRPRAHLNGDGQKAIVDGIKSFIGQKFFVEKRNHGTMEEEKQNKPGAESSAESENGFEILKEHFDLLKYDLKKTIEVVREIAGDDLDIDFVPAEKHFAGNIKEQMELLLEKGRSINEKSPKAEVEEYAKELEKLDKFAEEINALDGWGMFCVIHDGNTFFIHKKHEAPLKELERTVRDVVGNQYLSAFIYGIEKDYVQYVSELRGNSRWAGLTNGKKREFKEKGIAFYVDEILRDNEKNVSDDVREKMYKYAFAILNQ